MHTALPSYPCAEFAMKEQFSVQAELQKILRISLNEANTSHIRPKPSCSSHPSTPSPTTSASFSSSLHHVSLFFQLFVEWSVSNQHAYTECLSLIEDRNATFTIKFNTQPGENVYLCGNTPELGEWNITKAKKMCWNCGNTWDVEVGFDQENPHLQYKYFVQVDETKDIRWEKMDNRDVYVGGDGAVFEDKWESKFPTIHL